MAAEARNASVDRPVEAAGSPSICWMACSEPARSTTTVAVLGSDEEDDVSVTSRRVPSSVTSTTVWVDSTVTASSVVCGASPSTVRVTVAAISYR